MNTNQIYTGNAVQLVLTTGGILYHQGNLQHVAGAGIAKQITWSFPGWRAAFNQHNGKLGTTWLWPALAANGQPLWVATAYSQEHYGYSRVHTDPAAFRLCLLDLQRQRQADPLLGAAPLYMPYGIGCGLGGGDWTVIGALIGHYASEAILVSLPT